MMKKFKVTIEFEATDLFEAVAAFGLMRETFCNNNAIAERQSLLEYSHNNKWMTQDFHRGSVLVTGLLFDEMNSADLCQMEAAPNTRIHRVIARIYDGQINQFAIWGQRLVAR